MSALSSYYRQGAWAPERIAAAGLEERVHLVAALAEEQGVAQPRPWLVEALQARLAALAGELAITPQLATEPEQCLRCLDLGIMGLTIAPGERCYRFVSAAREGFCCADCFARLREEAAAS